MFSCANIIDCYPDYNSGQSPEFFYRMLETSRDSAFPPQMKQSRDIKTHHLNTLACVSIFNEDALWPELCRLILRRLGKSRCRISLLSWMEAKLLLAITRVSRLGNMEPNLRTSAQSCRLLSVMWSRRRVGQATLEALTLLYSLRHRNNSSSLQNNIGERQGMNAQLWDSSGSSDDKVGMFLLKLKASVFTHLKWTVLPHCQIAK